MTDILDKFAQDEYFERHGYFLSPDLTMSQTSQVMGKEPGRFDQGHFPTTGFKVPEPTPSPKLTSKGSLCWYLEVERGYNWILGYFQEWYFSEYDPHPTAIIVSIDGDVIHRLSRSVSFSITKPTKGLHD